MTTIRDPDKLRQWVLATQGKAQKLLCHTGEISSVVFSSGDYYRSFLDLTAKLHYFDAYNLLLIWERLPSASCLAGYKVWEQQVPTGTQILKKEQLGKGIELIAPFTDSSDGQTKLVWYSVSVFDISQTTISVPYPVFDPAYIHDADHIYFLLDAIKSVLGSKFDKSFCICQPSQIMEDLGLPGEITESAVIARSDLSEDAFLRWSTEALSQLAIGGSLLEPPLFQLLSDSICYCLLQIWDLGPAPLSPGSDLQLRAVSPEQQLTFCHLLRDTVRELNNLVCSYYLLSRREAEDVMLLDPDALFGPSQEDL